MVESFHNKSSPQSVRRVFGFFNEGLLKLDPAFQRSGVWQQKQRVHLLESIFQGYPIPSVFLYRHVDEGTGKVVFELIEGKQRLESLLMYPGLMTGRANSTTEVGKTGKR